MKPQNLALYSILFALLVLAGCAQPPAATPINEGSPAPSAPSPQPTQPPAPPSESAPPVSAPMPAPGFEGKVDEMIVNPEGGSMADMPMHGSGMGLMMPMRVIEVEVDNWYFEPDTITVKQGEHVKLVLHVEKGFHGFALPAFGISNKTLSQGSTVEVEFVADQKGSFPFFCNVSCGSGHSEMRGTLVVE